MKKDTSKYEYKKAVGTDTIPPNLAKLISDFLTTHLVLQG